MKRFELHLFDRNYYKEISGDKPEGWEKIGVAKNGEPYAIWVLKHECGGCGGRRHGADTTGLCQACKAKEPQLPVNRKEVPGSPATGIRENENRGPVISGEIPVDIHMPHGVYKVPLHSPGAVALSKRLKGDFTRGAQPPQGHPEQNGHKPDDLLDRVWRAFDGEDRGKALEKVFAGERFNGLDELVKRELINAALDVIENSRQLGTPA